MEWCSLEQALLIAAGATGDRACWQSPLLQFWSQEIFSICLLCPVLRAMQKGDVSLPGSLGRGKTSAHLLQIS